MKYLKNLSYRDLWILSKRLWRNMGVISKISHCHLWDNSDGIAVPGNSPSLFWKLFYCLHNCPKLVHVSGMHMIVRGEATFMVQNILSYLRLTKFIAGPVCNFLKNKYRCFIKRRKNSRFDPLCAANLFLNSILCVEDFLAPTSSRVYLKTLPCRNHLNNSV